MDEQDGKHLLEAYAAGQVTHGEISEAMFFSSNNGLRNNFLKLAGTGGVDRGRLEELMKFLSQRARILNRRAQDYRDFVSKLKVMIH